MLQEGYFCHAIACKVCTQWLYFDLKKRTRYFIKINEGHKGMETYWCDR